MRVCVIIEYNACVLCVYVFVMCVSLSVFVSVCMYACTSVNLSLFVQVSFHSAPLEKPVSQDCHNN